jgi:predicted Zn-dependent peptidase
MKPEAETARMFHPLDPTRFGGARPRGLLRAGVVALLLTVLFSARPVRAQEVPVKEIRLSNGMKALFLPRHDEATIAGGWVAHVGSSNERPGITGIAHLFEHMMFKGTTTIGTKNLQKDLEIINEQERIRDLMRAEEAKVREAWRLGEVSDPATPENMTPRWRELSKQFNEQIALQRQIIVKNEFDKIYTTAGASGMNAFTTEDMTGYFLNVPANKLELWMWMESDRIFHPVFREFYAERDVVYEERRMRAESTPLGKFAEAFASMFWTSCAYHWPVLGWPSDVSSISKAQADEFYSIYYAPQNLTLILVGDFDPGNAATLAEKYFGRIPAGKQPPPDVITTEVKQPAEKRMNAEAETNPQVDIWWHGVPFQHRDSYALDVLGQILSTRTGRLFKGLVLGKQVATDASANQDNRKWAGLFEISGEARDGHTPEEVEQAIYAEVDKLKTGEVPAHELQKVKNTFAADEYRKLSANYPILMQLIQYEGLGDWTAINTYGPRVQAVTAADVKRVAAQYFTKEARAVAIYQRKPGSPPAAAGPEK